MDVGVGKTVQLITSGEFGSLYEHHASRKDGSEVSYRMDLDRPTQQPRHRY